MSQPVPQLLIARCLTGLLLCVTCQSQMVQAEVPAGTDAVSQTSAAADAEPAEPVTIEELKAIGARRSQYLRRQAERSTTGPAPQQQLAAYRAEIGPILARSCVDCHGPDTQEGNIRIDTLNPDLVRGDDVSWWLEVFAVLSKGEMPPADAEKMPDQDRARVIAWLSSEIQTASMIRRSEQGHSSFRRMTRYEYSYSLQDLLGLPYDFGKDLPPDAASEDGFQNSSEMLHMSSQQLATYRESSRRALLRATVRGDQPQPLYWSVSMHDAAAREFAKQDKELNQLRQQFKDDPDKLEDEIEKQTARYKARPGSAHYLQRSTDRTAQATWQYPGAKYAWAPDAALRDVPDEFDVVAILPPHQRLIVELGDQIPEEGLLRVRIRAARASVEDGPVPSLQLEFGWQASNDSHAATRVSLRDIPITATPDRPEFYQWDIPLGEVYPRNSVRGIWKMGDLPSPSEYVRFVNSSVSGGEVQIDHVEVSAPVYDQWPPSSHVRIFGDAVAPSAEAPSNEAAATRQILTGFMSRAWRRPVTDEELDQKLALFNQVRPVCDDFQAAMVEVLATVLASPKFLYLAADGAEEAGPRRLSPSELATRLSMFLWCSIPDDELLQLAAGGRLSDPEVLAGQVRRMLADERSRRFSKQFVRQWLDMQLLDFLQVDRKVHPQFDPSLKEAMQVEPVEFFHTVLQHNYSVLDFIHADYTLVNERLARHYGITDVAGNDFRLINVEPRHLRGGLLTQAGLLAMNSDGRDSHPLKRGIWLLESLLNDPPPPPPPAVPEIDLADPEIAKLTLKERIENHRNHAACRSCHQKIDPWGIAFENFDATGRWRADIDGKPVDSTSELFNGQKLQGVNGLKRFLLLHRQDQFTRAMVHKLATFALGRPLTFGDRAAIDDITAIARKEDDRLATMIQQIVSSDLFQSK